MKATGIIRRVDDLGRVVIPRELRKNIGIREGEPLEIFTTDCGVMFRKYQPNLEQDAQNLFENVEQYFEGEDEEKDACLLALEKALKYLRK